MNKLNKKVLILTAVFGLHSIALIGQKIRINEGREQFHAGSFNAISVVISSNELSEVEKGWKNKIKEFDPEKTSDKKGEWFFDNARFDKVGNGLTDVITKFSEDKTNKTVTLFAAFDLSGGVNEFVSSSGDHSNKFNFFEDLVKKFALEQTKEGIQKELKLATKALENLQEKQKDIEKDNKELEEDITNYNYKITKAKENIEKNKIEIEKKVKEIEAQTKVQEEIKAKLNKVD
jgi:predicted RND superfamily exporter protein